MTSVVRLFRVSAWLGLPAFSAAVAVQSPWLPVSESEISKAATHRLPWIEPVHYQAIGLDESRMERLLAGAAKAAGRTTLQLPRPDGRYDTFRIAPVEVMSPGLASWMESRGFPMQTFRGHLVSDQAVTLRLDYGGPQGFHASVTGNGETYFIDPLFRRDTRRYASYFKRNYRAGSKRQSCGFESSPAPVEQLPKAGTSTFGNLRSYRLAVAATGEYTDFHGGTAVDGQAAIVTSINRVNQIYERDVSIRMILVGNNMDVVYTDGGSDPYTNSDGETMLTENQQNLDAVIGFSNYDIGHVFSTGGGGIAGFGVVCGSAKAEGVTGSSSPVNDPYDIDFVAHEIGHQWRGDHTFNSVTGSCEGNRSPSVAYEPGSGSTIMAYAGICDADNLQMNSDAYFHGISLDEILDFSAGATCGVNIGGVNGNAPLVSFVSPDNLTIPIATGFELEAQPVGSPDGGESYTYMFEQFDLGPAASLAQGDTGSGPILRSRPPTSTPRRRFAGGEAGEILPTTSRDLTFRVTVRDNNPEGGRVGEATLNLSSTTNAGPFTVTSPNGGESLSQMHTVTWDVAGTDGNGVDAAQVDILLSTDGGQSYSETLMAGTANDGSETVALPQLSTSTARIRIKASNHIFLDDSDADFSIGKSAVCSTPGTAIPDNGTTDDDLLVTETGVISDLDVEVRITHSYNGDVRLTLTHVDTGSSTLLLQEDGNCFGSDIDVTFDDEASQSVGGQCGSSYTGTVQPGAMLGVFDGEDLDGTWRLTVEDTFGGDVGTLDQWCLTAEAVPAPPDVSVDPTLLDFGSAGVGGQAPTRTFTISNNTEGPINVAIFHATGSAAEFPIVDVVGNNPLGGGETLTVEVGFSPEALGMRSATLGFTTDNMELAEITVMLRGTGSDEVFADGFESR